MINICFYVCCLVTGVSYIAYGISGLVHHRKDTKVERIDDPNSGDPVVSNMCGRSERENFSDSDTF